MVVPSANGWTVRGGSEEPDGAVGAGVRLLLLGKAMIGPLFSQTAWNSVTFTGARSATRAGPCPGRW